MLVHRLTRVAPRILRRTTLPVSVLAIAAVLSTVLAVPLSQAAAPRRPLPPTTTTTTSATTTTTTAATSSSASSSPSCNGSPDGLSGAWTCTFDDEFNGTSLNTNLWQPMLTSTSGFVAGYDCYVNNPQTISVSGGYLNLSIIKTPNYFPCTSSYWSDYEAGMVTTYSSFSQTYGAYEVRAKLPAATVAGLQETFWLYPKTLTYGAWPASGEIDFAEFYSEYANYDIPYIHYSESGSDPNVTSYNCIIDPSQFNTYGLEWTPGNLTVLYNGKVCLSDSYKPTPGDPTGAPFNQPFFLALTQALGMSTNAPTASTPTSGTTQIDWVRAWQQG